MSITEVFCLYVMHGKTAWEGAIQYAEWGWVPLPLVGKRPIVPGWTETSLSDWKERWGKQSNARNVGILTGTPSKLVVIDVDVSDGGVERWAQLEEEHGAADTLRVLTGGGGLHVYFRWEGPPLPTSARCFTHADGSPAGIDVRAEGGQVVAPPSRHPVTRSVYELVPPLDWDEEDAPPLAPLPDWLRQVLETLSPTRKKRAYRRR